MASNEEVLKDINRCVGSTHIFILYDDHNRSGASTCPLWENWNVKFYLEIKIDYCEHSHIYS